jgi:hypothetical protein
MAAREHPSRGYVGPSMLDLRLSEPILRSCGECELFMMFNERFGFMNGLMFRGRRRYPVLVKSQLLTLTRDQAGLQLATLSLFSFLLYRAEF